MSVLVSGFINHGLHRLGSLTFAVMWIGAVVAADPAITVLAKQRYPWNGLVDLQFTITGTSGTKYDTSFTAKDVVGGTNITMATVRKSDGTAANVAKEPLLPGNYHWVWDAAADLSKDWKCDRMTVTGKTMDAHGKVQLWADGPYWAETNIGAEKATDYGYYFWWGDTVGYKRVNDKWVASDGSSSNFSFTSGNTPSYNKDRTTLLNKGWVTSSYVLVPKHDAAQKHWGGEWRLPTNQELNNLNSKCNWTWTTKNGVKGYVIKGKGDYSSASIFLPAAGWGRETSTSGVGSNGRYWSSVPSSDADYIKHYSFLLYFTSTEYRMSNGNGRWNGQSIRPVQSP